MDYISVASKYTVEGGKRILILDAREWPTGASVIDYPEAMMNVVKELMEVDVDTVVVSDIYSYVYDERSTELLKGVAKVYKIFKEKGFWSFELSEVVDGRCTKLLEDSEKKLREITYKLWPSDPVKAYVETLKEIKRLKELKNTSGDRFSECFNNILTVFSAVRTYMESTDIIRLFRDYITSLREPPKGRDIYRLLLREHIKPSFVGAGFVSSTGENLEIVDTYSIWEDVHVTIYRDPSAIEYLYYISAPEFSLEPEKYFVLEKAKEIVGKHTPPTTLLSSRSFIRSQFRDLFRTTIENVAGKNGIKIKKDELELLTSILERYTIGYGVLELLFSDRNITDIYLDAPIGLNPVYVVHSRYGQCRTNVVYSEEEAKSLVSKLRSMSGRPFDEAHPVLDYDIPDLHVRVAVVGPPLSPDGIAFAFRVHRSSPWTLPLFLSVKMVSPLAAGLLSFLVDSQATILVAGSRGAGKTSLMTSLILEIPQNQRILVQEDTLEIPVEEIRKTGFHIQRLKTRSPIGGGSSGELPPEDALRTALRLGDSAIVVGEVRSKEAKVLYEAMRVGAAGNVVMGTIHGDSAYSVWDRVVNDLGVPTTSFKATDIVVVNAPIRFSGSLKRFRRTVSITEVRKHWNRDPEEEGGFLDLMSYDASKDQLELIEDNVRQSEFFEKIRKLRGLTHDDIWNEIRARASEKELVFRIAKQRNIPELMEAKYYVQIHNKYLLLREKYIEEYGEVVYEQLIQELKQWIEERIVRGLAGGK